MGPHVFACGNLALEQYLPAKRPTLQWGRTFLRAEIRSARPLLSRPNQLQWGRTFLRAEIALASNKGWEQFELQWGRTFLRAEIPDGGYMCRECVEASMGPHVFACGNLSRY